MSSIKIWNNTCVCRRVLTSHCWGAGPQPWILPKDQTHLETPIGGVGIKMSTLKQRRKCDHTKATQSFYFLRVYLMSLYFYIKLLFVVSTLFDKENSSYMALVVS